MTAYRTAGEIINKVAAEVGLTPVADPYASTDKAFVQLRYLLDTAGQELLGLKQDGWQQLKKEHSITTVVPGDTGDYSLPSDFGFMIDQTGWDFTNDFPLGGPLNAQTWKWLEGSNLVNSTIYASFQIGDNKFRLFPQPPANGLTIKFEYCSRNWVDVNGAGTDYTDTCVQAADIPLFEFIVLQKFLKLKWLEAKGFDTTAAANNFMTQFEAWSGRNGSAPIVNLSRGGSSFPLMDSYRNTPDRGYGS